MVLFFFGVILYNIVFFFQKVDIEIQFEFVFLEIDKLLFKEI